MKYSLRLQRKYANWLIVVYALALILLSVISISGGNSISKRHWIGIRADYVIHATFFLPWMTLASLRWPLFSRSMRFWTFLWIGFTLAASSEFVQLWVPHKTFNLIDLAANCLGVCFGAIFSMLFSLGAKKQQ
jgi:glycopeptide antibiotics resistance protein